MKVLLPIDGSEFSNRAVKYAIKHLSMLGKKLQLTLVHVNMPLLHRVELELGKERVARIHQEDADFALKSARTALNRAHVPFQEKILMGDVGSQVATFAQAGKYELILMGSHGHGALQSLFLGSVTTKVLAQCTVPVLIVR